MLDRIPAARSAPNALEIRFYENHKGGQRELGRRGATDRLTPQNKMVYLNCVTVE